jgi:surface protein
MFSGSSGLETLELSGFDTSNVTNMSSMFAKAEYLSTLNVKDKQMYGHPTIKPLPLIRKLIRNSSKENEIVLDCFICSGTTAVASLLENRKFIGFEINKKYYDIALKRISEVNKEDD